MSFIAFSGIILYPAKLHLDTNDIGLPISSLVTSASLHDSQAAIPLIKLTSRKVTRLP